MASGLRFVVTLMCVWLVVLVILVLRQNLLITGHDGDLLHTLDLVYRMAEGDTPHVDFMTPLGVLTIWPIGQAIDMGFGPGMSIRLAQGAFALAIMPMVVWVSLSRLQGALAYVFGIGVILMVLALVFGGNIPSLSVSMYYNRWAWALTSMIVLILFLPARDGWRNEVLDGVFAGLCVAALVLIKLTFVVALVPFGLVAVLHDRRGRFFLTALVSVAAVLGLVTLFLGGGAFWLAYLRDLLLVAGSDLRAYPGEDFGSLVGKPAFMPGTVALLTAIVFWRKTKRMREGLLLLILAPGWIYITYQNWGNDPKWLFLLAILLLAIPAPDDAKPFWSVPAARFGQALALVCLSLFAPSMVNLATSAPRHLLLDETEFAPIFNDLARSDLRVMIATHRLPNTQGKMQGISFGPVEEEDAEEETEPLRLNGEELAYCQTVTGLVGWMRVAAEQLGAVEEAVGRTVMAADLLDVLWLFGPFERTPDIGPWYYGSDRGFEAVDYVMVPLCPMSIRARERKLNLMEEKGWTLEEVIRTDLFILLRRLP